MAVDVERVRRFNRFYTRQMGLLAERTLEPAYPLTQVRVLCEVSKRPGVRPMELADELGFDPGYMSRMLAGFHAKGLVERTSADGDKRVRRVQLTAKGRAESAKLDAQSNAGVEKMLAGLSGPGRERLVAGMAGIEGLLTAKGGAEKFIVRTHGPGDIGWVVARHGELYAKEYGWNTSFEGLVAEIAGKFLTQFDAARSGAGSRRMRISAWDAAFW